MLSISFDTDIFNKKVQNIKKMRAKKDINIRYSDNKFDKCFLLCYFLVYLLRMRRALPGESSVHTGAGAPPMRKLMRNWASGIPRLKLAGV